MSEQLKGVLPVLPTPFSPDDSVNTHRLRELVDRHIDAGVHGLVACGSGGEVAALTSNERRLVVETVVEQVSGRVPVVAQTGATSTSEAVRLSRHAAAAGADVIMAVTPYYEPLSLTDTLTYLRNVASSVEIPFMIYNIPGVTGVSLAPAAIGGLAHEVPNIKYVKNTNEDMGHTTELIRSYGDVVSTFMGWDNLLLSSLSEGAAGVILGTANLVPARMVSIYNAVLDGKLDIAREEWAHIYPLVEAVLSSPYIPAVKAGLGATGSPFGNPREPLQPLKPEAEARIQELTRQLQVAKQEIGAGS